MTPKKKQAKPQPPKLSAAVGQIGALILGLDPAELPELYTTLGIIFRQQFFKDPLLGSIVIGIRPLTREEKNHHGWEDTPATGFLLDDGTVVYAGTDAEAEMPAPLFFRQPDGKTFSILPQRNADSLVNTAPPEALIFVMASAPNPDYGQFVSPSPAKEVEIQAWPQASRLAEKYIGQYGLGGGNWDGRIYQGGKQIAYVAYNGRVFEGQAGDWSSERLCLYDPYKELVTASVAREQLDRTLNRAQQLFPDFTPPPAAEPAQLSHYLRERYPHFEDDPELAIFLDLAYYLDLTFNALEKALSDDLTSSSPSPDG